MGKAFILVIALLAGLCPAHAAERLSGARVLIAEDVVIADDLYVAAQSFELRGVVEGDLVVVAREANLAGTVGGDLMLAVGQARVASEVAGSLRVAAGELHLSAPVAEDAVVAASQADLGAQGAIGRDLLLATGQGEVAAPVAREAMIAAGSLQLNGPIAGSVLAQVRSLSLGPNAQIGGNLTYTSEEEASVAPGARIAGQVQHREPSWAGRSGLERAALFAYGWLRSLIGLLLAGLLWLAVFPVFTRRSESVLAARPLASLGTGLVATLGLPLLSALLFGLGLLIGGWWLGLIGLGAVAVGLVLGTVVAGVALGDWVLARLGRTGVKPGWALLPGLTLLLLVGLVPWLGTVVLLLAALLGLGALAIAGLHGRTGSPLPA